MLSGALAIDKWTLEDIKVTKTILQECVFESCHNGSMPPLQEFHVLCTKYKLPFRNLSSQCAASYTQPYHLYQYKNKHKGQSLIQIESYNLCCQAS